ncbi:MAG: hypothetical protein Q4E17_06350 [Synergistes sp.]|nr:hypothetical protein [Synergistes sp.]
MKKIFCIFVFAAVFAHLNMSCAFAVDFCAAFTEKFGDEKREGTIYMTDDKSRFELKGTNCIEISRADQKLMWLIFPRFKSYIEEKFDGVITPGHISGAFTPNDTPDTTREDLGYETVDTYRLKKYLVTVKYNNGSSEEKYYEWRRSDFPMPVRTESMNGLYGYEYKKIKMSKQDPNLFREPISYKKITWERLEELEAKAKAKDETKKK